MKKALKYGFRILLFLITLLLLYGLIAIVLSFFNTRPDVIDCDQPKQIYISNNGIHLDVIIPSVYLAEAIIRPLQLPAATNYVAFGWGDKGFYLNTPRWEDLKMGTAFRAMFWKSETVMHITGCRGQREDWKTIALCDQQLKELQDFILQSFQKSDSNDLMMIPNSGYGQNDVFYEAVGNYSCFKTCNNWTNIALKKAKVKTAIWSPFAFGVLWHL